MSLEAARSNLRLPLEFSVNTERLLLRPYRLSDHQCWRDVFLNMPATENRWVVQNHNPEKLSRKAFAKHVAEWSQDWAEDKGYAFAAFERTSHQLIGQISLMDISRAIFQNAYIGYTVHMSHWRKGYGKEMLKAMMDVAFQKLGLHRIEAAIEPENIASIRLAESAGLRKEGLSKRRLYFRKAWCDMLLYAITSEECGIQHHCGTDSSSVIS